MTVIDLERRTVERLALQLEPLFAKSGTLVAEVEEVASIEWWRKAARLAGRNIGQPVRTMLSSDRSTVFAFLDPPVELGRQPDPSLAARSDPWVPDRQVRQLIAEHERVLSSDLVGRTYFAGIEPAVAATVPAGFGYRR